MVGIPGVYHGGIYLGVPGWDIPRCTRVDIPARYHGGYTS